MIIRVITAVLLHLTVCILSLQAQPVVNFKGRIAWSADGNFNDEDDWAASPLALAIFAKAGLKDRLVHFDYNCILPRSDKVWAANHKKSVLGAVNLYGYDPSKFFDCQEDLNEAIQNITEAVNASSEDNPLYFILAGPMEVPFLGISKSEPAKRKFVYCISHSNWNDGYKSGTLIKHNKRDIIPTGVTWIQISDQNQWLNTSIDGANAITLSPGQRRDTDANWKPWWWMRDSGNPDIHFLWEMLQMETRGDASDAGMAYFLVTGDEEAEIPKIRWLLENGRLPDITGLRKKFRLEAENFETLNEFKVEYIDERACSQRISVVFSGNSISEISTGFKEYCASSENIYNIKIHYYSGRDKESEYGLYINNILQESKWKADTTGQWQIKTIAGIKLHLNDRVSLQVNGKRNCGIKIDYIDLEDIKEKNPFRATPVRPLHDPEAMPGQLVIADKTKNYPGYLAYNGIGPAFLCGPDNPETFLWFGDQFRENGTVEEGGQNRMIQTLAENNVNAIHFQMFRMRKCNYKDEGDDRHAPFTDNDPSKELNENVLNQWDDWFTKFENAGITIHLEFYNDATDVEMMGWKPGPGGVLHPDEARFIQGIVNRFKHHKNILWGIEESANKLDRNHVAHFREMAALISEADNFHHPVVQSFVVRNDPEKDFHPYSGLPDDYIGDPNIDIITWLHVSPHGDQYEDQYIEYRQLYDIDHENFIVQKNETFHHPRGGMSSRVYMWACTMTKTQCLEAYHHADNPVSGNLFEDGLISTFMEQTDYQNMEPRNDLKFADTRWILAKPGKSYIAYSYNCESGLGLKQMTDGVYKLTWMDTVTGEVITQYNISVAWGDHIFKKPPRIGKEAVVYIVNSNPSK